MFEQKKQLRTKLVLQALFVTGFFMLLTAMFASTACAEDQVCIRQQCFNVEVVATPKDRFRGLQGRTSLGKETGMLFVFPSSEAYSFWMKETLIPLDIIWIDEDFSITHIAADCPPCKADPCTIYGPHRAARYVLEINAGLAQKYGFVPEDLVRLELDFDLRDVQ